MPGLASGIDPKLIEQLIEIEKIPVEKAKQRRDNVKTEKDEILKFQGFLDELGTVCDDLKTRADFYKLKVESSHPDIIEGIVESGVAMLGTYEFEVRGMARAEKELAYGFPDKNETPVGFGYMLIEREDLDDYEVIIEPGSTLQDVANQINDADVGVRAMVINTKYKPDSYRLLVISEQSGKEAKVIIDEDTTFLEFKEQVTGRNLDILFEDVPVTDEDNTLEELLDGVVFHIKRSEPGTRVQVSIVHDIDATLESIKAFVEKYGLILAIALMKEDTATNGKRFTMLLVALNEQREVLKKVLADEQLHQAAAEDFYLRMAIIYLGLYVGVVDPDQLQALLVPLEEMDFKALLDVDIRSGSDACAAERASLTCYLRTGDPAACDEILQHIKNIVLNEGPKKQYLVLHCCVSVCRQCLFANRFTPCCHHFAKVCEGTTIERTSSSNQGAAGAT